MTQIFLFNLIALPLLGCLIASLNKQNFFFKFADGILPVLFFANLIGLDNQFHDIIVDDIFMGFYLNKTAFCFLLLLNFLWLVLAFYFQRFWEINSFQKTSQLRVFLNFVIAFLVIIFVSKSLMVTLFFYSCLIIASQLFVVRFLRANEINFLRLFNFLLYFESFFFFLAMVATYKLVGRIDFIKGGIVDQNLGRDEEAILLIFFAFGLFFSVILPYFLFFRKIDLEPIVTYSLLFFSYSFSSLCILVKLIHSTFGFESFANIFAEGGFGVIESIFLFNVTIASVFLLFSKGLKLSFFYLFFQQFFVAIFLSFLLGIFDSEKIYLSLISFSLAITLVFFSVSNIATYLAKSEEKTLLGLFYKLPISTSLLIFGIVSMAGLTPTICAVEKFFVLKAIWHNHLWISAAVIFVNSLSLLIVAGKLSYHFLSHKKSNSGEENFALARDIDFDSRLILTSLLTLILMLVGVFVRMIT